MCQLCYSSWAGVYGGATNKYKLIIWFLNMLCRHKQCFKCVCQKSFGYYFISYLRWVQMLSTWFFGHMPKPRRWAIIAYITYILWVARNLFDLFLNDLLYCYILTPLLMSSSCIFSSNVQVPVWWALPHWRNSSSPVHDFSSWTSPSARR